MPFGFSDDEMTNTIGKSENNTITMPTMCRHPVARNQRPKLNGRRGPVRFGVSTEWGSRPATNVPERRRSPSR